MFVPNFSVAHGNGHEFLVILMPRPIIPNGKLRKLGHFRLLLIGSSRKEVYNGYLIQMVPSPSSPKNILRENNKTGKNNEAKKRHVPIWTTCYMLNGIQRRNTEENEHKRGISTWRAEGAANP